MAPPTPPGAPPGTAPRKGAPACRRLLRNWGAHPPRVPRRTPSSAAASASARAVTVSSKNTACPQGGWRLLRNWRRNPLRQPHLCLGLYDLAQRPGVRRPSAALRGPTAESPMCLDPIHPSFFLNQHPKGVPALEVRIWREVYGRQAVDGKGGNTTWLVDIPFLFRLPSNRPPPNIKEPPFAPGGTADWAMISNAHNSPSSSPPPASFARQTTGENYAVGDDVRTNSLTA